MSMDLANALKQAAVSYEAFSTIAEVLPWPEIEERHESHFGPNALGLILDLYRFPPDYLQRDTAEAYVRAILSAMAFSEEWDPDFWQISLEERTRRLTLGRSIYEGYAIVRNPRMQTRDWEYLTGEATFFGGGSPPDIWEACSSHLERADVLEIGGSYGADYIYLAVKDNWLLLVSCGVWD